MPSALKHRWSVGNNYLAGITAGDWWRLLREQRFAVDPVYWHRAACISAASVLNSLFAAVETLRYGAAIERVTISDPPLFIVGHWRSGTTLLHYLLAQDTRQFCFASTFQAINPRSFLTTEAIGTRLFAGLVPKHRPMDNLPQSFRTPQEDELALLLLTLRSPYLGISFPASEKWFGRCLTFRDVPESEVRAWKSALLWFVKKLTYRYRRAVLLKSPAHTGKIRLLLDLFPKARFVHIHRHPYEVYQSVCHYFDTAPWYTYLQQPRLEGIEDRILQRYTDLYDAWFRDRDLIPDGQFCEVAFDSLRRDPVGVTRDVYQQLGLPGFAECRPGLEEYVQSLAGYQQNRYPPLSREWRSRVAESWQRSFEVWGYDAD